MKVAVIGETVPPQKGGVKASESQVNTERFDMAMAAVMALLAPNSGESLPAPNQIVAESVFSEEIACPSLENRSSQKTGDFVPQQGLLPGALNFDVLDADGTQQPVTVEEAQLPPQHTDQTQLTAESMPVIKQAEPEVSQAAEGAVRVAENTDVQHSASKMDSIIKDAKTVDASKDQFPLFAEAIRESGAMPKKPGIVLQGASQDNSDASKEPFPLLAEAIRESGAMPKKTEIVLPGATQNINYTAEGDSIRAAPSGMVSNEGKLAPEKTSAVFTPEANAQDTAAQGNIKTETGQGRSTGEADKAEVKGNFMHSGKIEAGGTSSDGEAKNESSGFKNSTGDAFQPSPAQLNAAGTLSGPAKNLKGVSLTDLKNVLVQEIKHVYDTRKGEQTQVQINLEPENLGKLTIKLSYSNGELNAHFYAVNDHVKEILESSIGQLRESLGRQELVLNQAFVFVGNENNGGTGSQMEFGNRQTEFFPDTNSGRNYLQSKMEPDVYYQPDADLSGVNYLI